MMIFYNFSTPNIFTIFEYIDLLATLSTYRNSYIFYPKTAYRFRFPATRYDDDDDDYKNNCKLCVFVM